MSSAPTIRARVVKDGHSVAVRLPASLGLKPGDEVEVALRRLEDWPPGFFELEPCPGFPAVDRSRTRGHK